MAVLEKELALEGIVKVGVEEFEAFKKQGLTRFNGVLETFRTVDYVKDGIERSICIGTFKVGKATTEGVLALSMIKIISQMDTKNVVLDYTEPREYRGESTPSFNVSARL